MNTLNFTMLQLTFNACLLSDGDVALHPLIQGYTELFKICDSLGPVFGFVSNEVKEKADVIKKFWNDGAGKNYDTMYHMVNYERDSNLLYRDDFVSGSRTLIRIQRGIVFMNMFLTTLKKLDMEDKTSEAGRDAYDKVFADHHSWPIRIMARSATFTMPKKKILMQKVCGSDLETCTVGYDELLTALEEVFNRIQIFYENEGIQNLP